MMSCSVYDIILYHVISCMRCCDMRSELFRHEFELAANDATDGGGWMDADRDPVRVSGC